MNRGCAAAVILAAGQARRAGGPKAVWAVEGKPSVRLVAEAALAAASIGEAAAVTGAWADEVNAALAGLPVKIVHNPDYALGQSTSLAAGLRAVSPETRTAVFLLADQPFITSQIIDDLVKFQQTSGKTIVAPFFQGRRRNPVVFDLTRWREALLAAAGDQGGRSLIDNYPGEAGFLEYEANYGRCFLDFDTPDEYEGLRNESAQHSGDN